MRVSDYTIYVPLPKRGRHLLVHGYTGALDVVDGPLADYLKRCAAEGRGDCAAQLDADIARHLESRGYLTEESSQGERQLVRRLSEKLLALEHRTRSKFFIMPSYNCQLRCTYCFERGVQETGARDGWLDTVLSREMVDAAFAAMDALQSEPTRHPVSLYGGEPFTRANRQIVGYIVRRGNQLGYRFTAITNGVDLDAYQDILRPDLVEGLLVTIDGPRQLHDRARIFPDGRGSFNRIVRNVQMALDRGLKVRVRINTTWDVLDALPEFADVVRAQGWHDNADCVVYCQRVRSYHQPATATPQITPAVATAAFEDQPPAQVQPVALANIIRFLQNTSLNTTISAGEPIRYTLDMLSDNKPLAALSPTCCGSHKGMYLFDPFGRIYVCTEHVGQPEAAVGTFWPQVTWYPDKLTRWHERAVHNLPTCQRCRYAFLCAGGCAYLAQVEQGDMYHNHCQRFAEQFALITQQYFDGDGSKGLPASRVQICD